LNRNFALAWLSGYSDAFAFLKERATSLAKRELVSRNLAHAEAAAGEAAAARGDVAYDRRLVLALLDRFCEVTQAHGVPLVIQSIPYRQNTPLALVDAFPEEFAAEREGVWLLPMKPVLEPHLGHELLYWDRSHHHWTPFAHARSGEALAALIERQHLLEAAR
jgi:hypothetical protein